MTKYQSMNKHLVSIDDLSRAELEQLLTNAESFKKDHRGTQLSGIVIASLFYEPSTRIRLSFESATKYLEGQIIGFASGTTSSQSKGETLEDSIRVIEKYCDLIIMRHPESGSAARAADVSQVPIVNAGDGPNEHPTQTLLDLFSIQTTQGKLDGIKIGLAGDLKYGRTVHSLVKALSLFNVEFVFISPPQLALPLKYVELLESSGNRLETRESLSDISDLDILYMTRVQQERFKDPAQYEALKGSVILSKNELKNVKDNLKVLHPLPRVDEINPNVDDHPSAYYFDQVQNGLYVRQALLCKLLDRL